jgi:hypothetical protein
MRLGPQSTQISAGDAQFSRASETLIECRLSPNMIVVVFIAGVISPKARKRDAETLGNSSYFRSRTMEADSAKGPPN